MLPPETAVALVPELAVLSAGLFASQEEADHVLDKVLLAAFRPCSREGLRLLDWLTTTGKIRRRGACTAAASSWPTRTGRAPDAA